MAMLRCDAPKEAASAPGQNRRGVFVSYRGSPDPSCGRFALCTQRARCILHGRLTLYGSEHQGHFGSRQFHQGEGGTTEGQIARDAPRRRPAFHRARLRAAGPHHLPEVHLTFIRAPVSFFIQMDFGSPRASEENEEGRLAEIRLAGRFL